VQIISTIHDATIVNTGWKDKKTNMEVKKAYAVVQYNKFMKGIDRADQYLSYYSVLRITVKWSKKVVLNLLNCVLFNTFFMHRTLNTNKKMKYKNFLHDVGRYGILEVENQSESSSDDLSCQRSKQNQGGLNRTRQADSPWISEYTNLKKLLLVRRKKRRILQDSVKCKFFVVLLHRGSCFEKYPSVTNY